MKRSLKVPAKPSTVSTRAGYWFYFDELSPRIVVFSSHWSGRQAVLIDDEIVSDQRFLWAYLKYGAQPLRIAEFIHQGSKWTVTLAITNLWTGALLCTLFRDDQRIAESTQAYSHKDSLKAVCVAAAGVIIGASIYWLVKAASR